MNAVSKGGLGKDDGVRKRSSWNFDKSSAYGSGCPRRHSPLYTHAQSVAIELFELFVEAHVSLTFGFSLGSLGITGQSPTGQPRQEMKPSPPIVASSLVLFLSAATSHVAGLGIVSPSRGRCAAISNRCNIVGDGFDASCTIRSGGASTRDLHQLFASNDNTKDESSSDNSSSSNSTDNSSTKQVKKNIPSPPSYLSKGYNLASVLNMVAAMALVANRPTSLSTANAAVSSMKSIGGTATKLVQYQPNLLATFTSGTLTHLLLAAGSCSILSESVKTNRLFTSGTYKRLTMGTLMWSLLAMCSLPGEAGCKGIEASTTVGSVATNVTLMGATLLITQFAKFTTAVVSFIGWEYGAGGFGTSHRIKNILSEMGKGLKSVWSNMPVSDERPATFYRTFFILTLINVFFSLPELSFAFKHANLFSLPVSLAISSIARLGLLR